MACEKCFILRGPCVVFVQRIFNRKGSVKMLRHKTICRFFRPFFNIRYFFLLLCQKNELKLHLLSNNA
jgi:hypothetical protein